MECVYISMYLYIICNSNMYFLISMGHKTQRVTLQTKTPRDRQLENDVLPTVSLAEALNCSELWVSVSGLFSGFSRVLVFVFEVLLEGCMLF